MAGQLATVEYAEYQEWDPQEYLTEYYSELMLDDRFTLEWLVEAMQQVQPVSMAVEFGCGPIVHHAFPVVSKVAEMHLAEYLPGNRAEVEKWLAGGTEAHDWSQFTREILRMEGNSHPTTNDIQQREQLVRERVTAVLPGDARDENPLGIEKRESYPLVTSLYCAEGATNDLQEWYACMSNITSLVQPGGTFIMGACGAANYYRVGELCFPCAGVHARDVVTSLADNGFGDIDLRVRQVPDHSTQGFSTVILARAVKSTAGSD